MDNNPPTDSQLKQLHDALLDAFTFESLQIMTRISLGEDLEAIVPVQGRNLTHMTYDLVRVYAARDDGMHKLMNAAREVVPGNGKLSAVVDELSQIQFDILSLPEDICCHTFRGTGITVYLQNGGALEVAQRMAAHSSPETTKLYDRTSDEISPDEVEQIII